MHTIVNEKYEQNGNGVIIDTSHTTATGICNHCGCEIALQWGNKQPIPHNLDGSQHVCQKNNHRLATPPQNLKKELSPWIKADLLKSGLSEKMIARMRVEPIRNKTHLRSVLGFSSLAGQEILQATEAYLLPYPDTKFNRVRFQIPLNGTRYLSPKGRTINPKQIYYLGTVENLQQAETIILTEGEKKTAKCQQSIEEEGLFNIAVIGVPGVTMWDTPALHRLVAGKKQLLVAFDADHATNPDVMREIAKICMTFADVTTTAILTWDAAQKGLDDCLLVQSLSDVLRYPVTLETVLGRITAPWRDNVVAAAVRRCGNDDFSLSPAQSDMVGTMMPADIGKPVGTVFQRGNAAYIIHAGKTPDDPPIEIEIAAFRCEMIDIIESPDGRKYTLRLTSDSACQAITVTGVQLATHMKFRDTIMAAGMFLYHVGDIKTHNLWVDYIASVSNPRCVQESQHLGWVTQGWLCSDGLLTVDGKFIPIKKSPILPPEPKENKELKFFREPVSENIFKELHDNLFKVCGSQTWKILGFAIASFFADVAQKMFSIAHFPLLFMYGKRHTGKSSLGGVIQDLLGCRRAIGEYAFATQKANQRIASQYKNCVVCLNEYSSNEANNKLLCQLHDREGYNRAEKDNSLKTNSVDIHSTFVVISTLNITGSKSEDVHSRLVEVDTDKMIYDQDVFLFLSQNQHKFSACLPILIGKRKEFAEKLESVVKQLRKNVPGIPSRIVENVAVVWAGYELFQNCLMDDERTTGCCEVADAENCCKMQKQNTTDADLGTVFLRQLLAMVENKDISTDIAKVVDDNKLVFKLSLALPYVARFSKQSGLDTADQRTVAKSLTLLGAESKTSKRLTGMPQREWIVKLSDE